MRQIKNLCRRNDKYDEQNKTEWIRSRVGESPCIHWRARISEAGERPVRRTLSSCSKRIPSRKTSDLNPSNLVVKLPVPFTCAPRAAKPCAINRQMPLDARNEDRLAVEKTGTERGRFRPDEFACHDVVSLLNSLVESRRIPSAASMRQQPWVRRQDTVGCEQYWPHGTNALPRSRAPGHTTNQAPRREILLG